MYTRSRWYVRRREHKSFTTTFHGVNALRFQQLTLAQMEAGNEGNKKYKLVPA